jgi:hypothetical protein
MRGAQTVQLSKKSPAEAGCDLVSLYYISESLFTFFY